MSNVTPEIVEIEQAKAARLKRASAARSREYRERQKADKAPDTRTCDAAIVEAMAFVLAKYLPLARAKRLGTPLEQASIPFLEINRTALNILVHAGYNRIKSRVLIADRTASRDAHKDPRNVPALHPVDDPARSYSPRLWPGDPIPEVVPYKREVTPLNVFSGMSISDFLDDDGDDA